ncbi:hypothetical protein [Exercitatus varius]|uniref:hypothetical protein n=1 Tax=Exercitatus varius TaxID=67857 RepID=UPI00294B4577|nr:hypothetical protein [Exercitatus varius]MDG2943968.1 hypothetical protein [Exercitatus varius]
MKQFAIPQVRQTDELGKTRITGKPDSIYYAHSGLAIDHADWQTLSNHLSQVGEMAARFAGFFGAGETARYTGQLHDI